jgi:hypothetical protein
MQVLTNEHRYRRGRFLATVFSISGVLMLLSATVATLSLNLTVASFPLMLIGAITSLIGIRLSNRWVRPPLTHESLAGALKGTSKDAVLLNYYGPARHILIHPQGVFTLTTRNRPFSLHVNDDTLRDEASPWSKFQRFISQDSLGRPIPEAASEARRTAIWLEKRLARPVTVQPLVVFLHPDTRLNLIKQPAVPITYADKRKPSLKTYLMQEQPDRLQAEQIETLLASLSLT